jgi:hypothetical protein
MNSFQRFAVRLACRVAPPLGKLLNSAGGTVERLSEQVNHYRSMNAWQRDHNHEMQAELTEALALEAGGWMGAPVVRESLSRGGQELMRIKEMAYGPNVLDLELGLEDRGWQRLIATSQYEFSRYGIQQLIRICRLYKIKHPLISRGIAVSSHYVWGRGFEVSSPDETANEILEKFWQDPRNACELAPKALMEKEEARLTDGNLFWAFFSDPKDGQTLIRSLDPCEIEEIVSNPDDAGEPWYYKRVWSQNVFNEDTGERGSPVLKQGWYIAMGHEVDSPPEKIGGIELMVNAQGTPIPLLHDKSGGLPKWQFGLPPIYPALDHARAYTKFLNNWCTITDALARFAWNVETEGGAPAIATFKQVLATTLGNDGGASIDGNPAPTTASSFITGPGNKLTPIRTAGATTEPEQGRRVLLMVAAALGLPETFFGDASTGSLATAQSLDRPTELKFLEVQERWREWGKRISHYVLQNSKSAIKGKLREADAKEEKDEIIVDFKFPSVLEHDIPARINAIVEGMTLNGFQVSGIDEKIGVGLIMQELGVEDVQAVLDEMYPDWDPERIEEPDEMNPTSGIDPATGQPIPGAPQAAAPVDPTQKPGLAKAHPKKVHAKEAQLARAVAAIRRAALVMQERNGHARK